MTGNLFINTVATWKRREAIHWRKINRQSCTDREHQQSLSNYLKVNCEPLITSGNCRKKTLLANYISKSFRLTATYFSVLPFPPLSPVSLSFFSFLSSLPLPNFFFHIEESSVKGCVSFCGCLHDGPYWHHETLSRLNSKPQSTGEQLAQIYHHQVRNKASRVSLTQTAKHCHYCLKERSTSLLLMGKYIYAAINGIIIPVLVSLMRWHILFLIWFI